jgi:hypothetical protein
MGVRVNRYTRAKTTQYYITQGPVPKPPKQPKPPSHSFTVIRKAHSLARAARPSVPLVSYPHSAGVQRPTRYLMASSRSFAR